MSIIVLKLCLFIYSSTALEVLGSYCYHHFTGKESGAEKGKYQVSFTPLARSSSRDLGLEGGSDSRAHPQNLSLLG